MIYKEFEKKILWIFLEQDHLIYNKKKVYVFQRERKNVREKLFLKQISRIFVAYDLDLSYQNLILFQIEECSLKECMEVEVRLRV